MFSQQRREGHRVLDHSVRMRVEVLSPHHSTETRRRASKNANSIRYFYLKIRPAVTMFQNFDADMAFAE
jgi:hypothetical protein